MPERTDLVYACDGSLAGALCCVFESYTRKELPMDILLSGEPTLFPLREVETDEAHAQRVWRSLERISQEVCQWVRDIWYACGDGRLMLIYRFIRLAYAHGARVTAMYADPVGAAAFAAVRTVGNEAHFMKEFLRFSDYSGALVSIIEPKCIVLPFLQEHFASRFPEETFLIYDKTHGMALFYRPYEAVIQEVEELELPPAGETEQAFRTLWRGYYDAIAIEGRYNPKCRMGHMPKRYWKNMIEMAPELLEAGAANPRLRERGLLPKAK